MNFALKYPPVLLLLCLTLGVANGQVRGKRFQPIAAVESGITFSNNIKETAELNFFTYMNIYNGGGVAVGDVNNDGLPDLYFTGNMVPNKLYLNKGNLQFEDVTEKAGVAGSPYWTTGVTMADVNADGWLDIYVCQAGVYMGEEEKCANLLYLNNGDLTFTESAEKLGVADRARTNHATFFDYDGDDDMDLYVVNQPIQYHAPMDYRLEQEKSPRDLDTDKLFRQEADGTFTDVTNEAGVRNWAFGLSVMAGDLNNDGWTDLYVANDYSEKDNYWFNQGNGTFKEGSYNAFNHTSNFSMGSDMADFNNDGLLDLVVLDMMAEDNRRKKTNMSGMNPEVFWENVDLGRHFQYMQNMLQLNNGNGTFSEIAELAGTAYTDWSWTALFSDLDNDGWKDLLITNGMRRDVRNNDFSKNLMGASLQEVFENYEELTANMPVEKVANYVFHNQGNLTFKNEAENWGLDHPGFTNGAVTADLDRDGDLDVVYNNLDETASIYENHSSSGAFLQVVPKGPKNNPFGIGVRVEITTEEGTQMQELTLTRGFLSSGEPLLHFGLGNAALIKELKATWPGGKQTTMQNLPVNGTIIIDHSQASSTNKTPPPTTPWFNSFTSQSEVRSMHRETPYNDFKHEVLLPHKQSHHGPKIAVGDVNGDGLDDFFVGGAAGHQGELWVQQSQQKFVLATSQPWAAHAASEDVDAVFFDVDNDKDLDLYIASGSNEWEAGASAYQDRLYLNNKGTFTHAPNALPNIRESTGCVRPHDFDGDGDIDLFVGGRLVPRKYPFPARSTLLQNNGGVFTDVTLQVAPMLEKAGMVTDALWTDYDGDGDDDLMVAGEWMHLQTYRNHKGEFKKVKTGLEEYTGWWFSLAECDPDGDGDKDYFAGNLGMNSKYKGVDGAPFEVYCDDFDNNNAYDIVLSYFNEGKAYPIRGRECSSQQMPSIKEKFPTYEAFGNATVDEVYGLGLNKALHYAANWMYTSYIENKGNGKFIVHALPNEAQLSATQGIVVADFNGDGYEDVVMAGNLFHAEVETCRHDASVGVVMQGDGKGGFEPLPLSTSGFFAAGDVKDLKMIQKKGQAPLLLISRNSAPVAVFKGNHPAP